MSLQTADPSHVHLLETELSLRDYVAIVKRRYLYLIGPFLLVLTLSTAVALLMPPIFRATGVILVESQQIPSDLVQSTVTAAANERIQVIQQRVMTRANLLEIIQKFGLFADNKSNASQSELVEMIRSRVFLDLISENVRNRGRNANSTIAFSVSFEYGGPDLSLRVANELVTLFLRENAEARTSRAAETTNFLAQEAMRLKQDLEAMEDRIAAYKQENSSALPTNADLRLKMLDRTETELKDATREIKSLEEERRYYDVELVAAQSAAVGEGQSTALTPAQELARLRTERINKSAILLDSHPDMKMLQRRISALESQIQSGALASVDPATSRIKARIAATDVRIDLLNTEIANLNDKIDQLEKSILQTPQVERALAILTRDYDNAYKKYQEIKAKEMQAQIGESLEEGKKAERFTLLEPPVLPERPVSPNRQKILAFGFLLAIAAGAGGLIFVESIDGSIRGARSLGAIMQQQPLAVVPYIVTAQELHFRKQLVVYLTLGGGLLLVASAAAIHVFYMPLDIILIKVMARIG